MKSFGPGRMVHSNPGLTMWRNEIAIAARTEGVTLQEGPVDLVLLFQMPRGKTVKRELPHVRPDLDKLCRAVLDALEGIAYTDDGQVCRITADKRYARHDDPGVLIQVWS